MPVAPLAAYEIFPVGLGIRTGALAAISTRRCCTGRTKSRAFPLGVFPLATTSTLPFTGAKATWWSAGGPIGVMVPM
jgi:hypothetical protein